MTREAITHPHLPPPAGTYSPGIRAGGFVFLAGQTPRDANNVRHGDKPFEVQVRMTLDNLECAARAAGLSLKDAVRVGVFLRDPPSQAKEFDRIYAQYVGSPPPARTTVQSNLPGFDIEVDAILFG